MYVNIYMYICMYLYLHICICVYMLIWRCRFVYSYHSYTLLPGHIHHLCNVICASVCISKHSGLWPSEDSMYVYLSFHASIYWSFYPSIHHLYKDTLKCQSTVPCPPHLVASKELKWVLCIANHHTPPSTYSPPAHPEAWKTAVGVQQLKRERPWW